MADKRRIGKDDSGSPDVKARRKSLNIINDDKHKITDDTKPKKEESRKEFERKNSRDRARSMDIAQLKIVEEANEMLRKKEEADKRKSERRDDKTRERKPFEKSKSLALESPKNSPKSRSHRELKAENRIRHNSEDREEIKKKS